MNDINAWHINHNNIYNQQTQRDECAKVHERGSVLCALLIASGEDIIYEVNLGRHLFYMIAYIVESFIIQAA